MNIANKYNYWMEVETSYALSKFPSSAMYPYFERFRKGDGHSFKESCLNYVRRAMLFQQEIDEGPRAGLQTSQALGKAAHNLVALDSTAYSFRHGRVRQLASAMNTFALAARHLELEPAVADLDHLDVIEQERSVLLTTLQSPDLSTVKFRVMLGAEIIRASSLFVTAAERYGWPEPGRSSGDVRAME